MLDKNHDPFRIDEGELIFTDAGEGLRLGQLNMAKNALYALTDIVGGMQCQGFLKDGAAVRGAIDCLNAQVLREFMFSVKPERDGRFRLIRRRNP